MYDFETVIDRSGTDSVKYYFHPESKYEQVIPMFIADMDFETAPVVKKAIMDRAAIGIYGYTVYRSDYYAAVVHWLKSRHDLDIDSHWIVTSPGVVAAMKNAIVSFTEPGDNILIQEPVYHFFRAAPEANGRNVIYNELILEGDVYHIDFKDFERKIVENDVKMFILCNPHNPTGNIWTREELYRLGTICREHNVLVFSDEIHNDFIFPGQKHTPFLAVDSSFKDFTVMSTSPSKTFNLAGIKASNNIIPNEDLRKRFEQVKNAHGLGGSNTFASCAVVAAYTHGADWVDALVTYVQENFQLLDRFLKEKIPAIHMINHSALYLAWLDCRAWNMDNETLKRFFVYDCGILPSMGAEFGQGGAGFVRLNLSCPRSVLEKALDRLEKGAEEKGLL